MCQVVNLYKDPYDVYIGRAKWGEPYNIWCNPTPLHDPKDDIQRKNNLIEYKSHLINLIRSGKITKEMLRDLHGKTLGCFCKPKACHGDIILKAVKWAMEE